MPTTALLEEGRAAAAAAGPAAALAAAAGLTRQPVPLGLSQLQGVLKLAHSQEVADQQQAAMELAALVERSPLPALSFAPVAHALCRLLPNQSRATVLFAARAAKLLVLDDALRAQTLAVGLPRVLALTVRAWEEEVVCLRELLGAMQTLACDKATVKALLGLGGSSTGGGGKAAIPSAEEGAEEEEAEAAMGEAGALASILALLEARDGEVKALATATVANLCAYSDTLLLAHRGFLDGMRDQGLPALLQTVQCRDTKLLRCYAIAALANAALHPLLAGRLHELEGVEVIKRVEKENLGFGGTRITECAEAALARLGAAEGGSGEKGGRKERGGVVASAAGGVGPMGGGVGGPSMLGLGARRWTFKWGNQPVLELSIDTSKGRYGAVGCLLVWIVCFFLVLRPAFQSGGGSVVPGM